MTAQIRTGKYEITLMGSYTCGREYLRRRVYELLRKGLSVQVDSISVQSMSSGMHNSSEPTSLNVTRLRDSKGVQSMTTLNSSEVSERSRQYRKLSVDKNRKTYYLYIQCKPGEKDERSIENFDKDYLVERGTEWKRLQLIASWYVTYVGERFV